MPGYLNLIVTFALLALTLLLCTRLGKIYLFTFSVGCILVSNITVVKQVDLFPGLSMSLGVLIYSLVYLASNICSEYGDTWDAYKLAFANFASQIAFFVYMYLSIKIPPASAENLAQQAIVQLFSTTPRITVAAIIATLGLFVNIVVYEWLMKKYGKGFVNVIVRNNASTIIGQTVNTALFFFIAFYGVVEDLLQTITSALIAKVLIALAGTPFIILAGRVRPRQREDKEIWHTS